MKLLLKIWRILRLPPWLQLFVMRRMHDQFLVGTTGVFFDKKEKVLLFKHSYRDNGFWSLPGGYAKKGEHPRETLEREVKEESGISVFVDRILKIRTDRETARLDITYVGRVVSGKYKPSHEIKEAMLFPVNNLPPLPKDQILFIEKGLVRRRTLKARNHQAYL